MTAQRALALVLVFSVGFSGCASYKGTTALIPKPEGMPAMASAGPFTVGADPYLTKDRIKPVFDGDLIDEGVLAVQVFVRNGSDKRMSVRGADMNLTLPGGSQLSSAGATAVASRFEQGIGDVIGWGIGFGIIGMLAASANKEKVRSARLADYRSKELSEAFLEPGEAAHGFVFFMPPKGTPDLSDAMLTVHFVDTKEGSRESVRLPLRALAFTARAPAPEATPVTPASPNAVAPATAAPPAPGAGTPASGGAAVVAATPSQPPPLSGVWRSADGTVLTITGPEAGFEWELQTREGRIGASMSVMTTVSTDHRATGTGRATGADVVLNGRMISGTAMSMQQPITLMLQRDGGRLRGTVLGPSNVPFPVQFER